MYGPNHKNPSQTGKTPFFPVIEDVAKPATRDLDDQSEANHDDDPTHCKYCAWDGCRGCELRIGSNGFGTQPTHFVY
jgi:hypothetical protein